MNAPTKLGLFVAALGAVFAVALGVGNAVGPIGSVDTTAMDHDGTTGSAAPTGHGDEHDVPPTAPAVGGLEVSAGGYTLVPADSSLEAGPVDFRFRIDGPDGAVLTDYDVEHDQRLHLIVVRRDLSRYQHVHPTLDADGTWSVPVDLGLPGTYRVFADFTPKGASTGLTLGADVTVAGDQTPTPLPAPATEFEIDGYTVTLSGDVAVGAESDLTLSVERDGRPVTDLQPYLGAYGHLVTLRSGDLGYLHVHPDGEPGDGRTDPGPGVEFHTTVPSPGTYRLYFDFRHGDVVRTAEFTVVAGSDAAESDVTGSAGHDHGEAP